MLDHWRLLLAVLVGQGLATVVFLLSDMARGQAGALGDAMCAASLGLSALAVGVFSDWAVRSAGEAWLEEFAALDGDARQGGVLDLALEPTHDLQRVLTALARRERAWCEAFQRIEKQRLFTTTLALRAVHALKTPVQTAVLRLEDVRRGSSEDSEELDRRFTLLRQQLARIDTIVMQVLAGLRLEELHSDRRIESVLLVELVLDVINAFRVDFVLRGIVPRLEIEGDPREAVAPTDRK